MSGIIDLPFNLPFLVSKKVPTKSENALTLHFLKFLVFSNSSQFCVIFYSIKITNGHPDLKLHEDCFKVDFVIKSCGQMIWKTSEATPYSSNLGHLFLDRRFNVYQGYLYGGLLVKSGLYNPPIPKTIHYDQHTTTPDVCWRALH
ncbi:hypothetical protein AVEN_52132-1 [Araneus ventricosus]|uniref:Uncharacterized protein n=1 Tax=Araneus ventricosus TaxID=182803 RepID=A0A4Y2E4X7_ARAVE|nr:hypothetical protein AVEN_52132-1 [Araneus ventricosus]